MIKYVVGDATEPCIDDGVRIIAHVCNDIGLFGSGFAAAVMEKWPVVRERYLEWHKNSKFEPFKAGRVQFVRAEASLFIANMIGQNGVRSISNPVPVNYKALDECLGRVANFMSCYRSFAYAVNIPADFKDNDITLHMPRIACGLANGSWDKVEPLIKKHLEAFYKVCVYDLPEK